MGLVYGLVYCTHMYYTGMLYVLGLMCCMYSTTGKKIVFRTLGFILSTLGSVTSNVVLGTLNTFDGTDPKVDRVKPKVRNTIFFPCVSVIIKVTFRFSVRS